ncbi:MAG: hypothetical protein KJZ80_17115 [Hyphomicrobiaceae bacterium]|nr:hypothetical protein [Hyphomicrobiaceae bacterium]
MAKDPAVVFRTKVRVKGGADDAARAASAVERAPTPFAPPRSLMDALKQAAPPASSAAEPAPFRNRPGDLTGAAAAASTKTEPPPLPRPARATISSELPTTPKSPRAGKSRAGRLAAARLRQLQRLKDAAAGLETLARGEIEEATVEIIRHDGSRPADRGRLRGLPSKR